MKTNFRKIFYRFATIAFFCVFLCACATTEVSKDFPKTIKLSDSANPVALISAENYGYYLFGYIPLFAGDPKQPNVNTMAFFKDTVTLQNNRAMINSEAEKLGADTISSLGDSIDWTGGFSLWIVWKQVLKSSAMATTKEIAQPLSTDKISK